MSRLTRDELKAKILNHVTIEGDCWIWQKSFGSHGYGNISTGGGRNETVHRVSHEVFNGSISKGLLILHSCDNRKCCNPAHLRAGTRVENTKDALERSPIKRKLTAAEAFYIKESNLSQRKLAKMFGVSQRLVYSIKRGEAWVHTLQKESERSEPTAQA